MLQKFFAHKRHTGGGQQEKPWIFAAIPELEDFFRDAPNMVRAITHLSAVPGDETAAAPASPSQSADRSQASAAPSPVASASAAAAPISSGEGECVEIDGAAAAAKMLPPAPKRPAKVGRAREPSLQEVLADAMKVFTMQQAMTVRALAGRSADDVLDGVKDDAASSVKRQDDVSDLLYALLNRVDGTKMDVVLDAIAMLTVDSSRQALSQTMSAAAKHGWTDDRVLYVISGLVKRWSTEHHS